MAWYRLIDVHQRNLQLINVHVAEKHLRVERLSVPFGHESIHPECSDSAASDQSVAADVLLRQEPDEAEDEEEDDGKEDDEDEDTDDGYSE